MGERIDAIVIHNFTSSAEAVFESWLEPIAIRKWMQSALKAFGLPGDLVLVEVDARIGGTFCFSDNRPTGEAFHWGTYKQLDFPNCLAFTWNAGQNRADSDDELSLVRLLITPTDSGCDVKLVHSIDVKWKDYLERTENGWKNMLVHVDKLLSGGPASK